MTGETILIRCDANTEIGAGHFFRELALAQAAVDAEHRALLLLSNPRDAYVQIAAESGVELRRLSSPPASEEDANTVASLAAEWKATAVVVDGYQFDTSYYETLQSKDFTLAAVDDIAHQRFPVDVLVNVNPHANELDYDVPEDTRLLLGVDYALLRRQFREARAKLDVAGGPDVPDMVSRVLVTMGGGDATNKTSKILRALELADYTGEVDVVIGPSNPHRSTLEELADQQAADIRFHTNVSNMAELMLGQHLAICAAGGTSWELACLGVPMLQLVIADNQRPIADKLSGGGVSKALGNATDIRSSGISSEFSSLCSQRDVRLRMSLSGISLIDGRGAERLISEFLGKKALDE